MTPKTVGTNLVNFNNFLLCFMCAHTRTHNRGLLWICPLGFSFCSLHFHRLLVQMFCEVGPWFGYSKLFIRCMFTASCLLLQPALEFFLPSLMDVEGFFDHGNHSLSHSTFLNICLPLLELRHSTSLKNFKNLCGCS